jgi:hypothetical protein
MAIHIHPWTLKKAKKTSSQGEITDTALSVSLSPCLPVSNWWAYLVSILLILALAGCGLTPDQTTVRGSQSGGSEIGPEQVANNFFEDLRDALQDRQLSDDDRRGEWVERLASYFAPNERDDQRIALRSSLDSFVTGRDELDPSENLLLEVRYDRIEKISQESNRATVRPVNGSIYVLITRTTATGTVTLYEDNVSLEKIIGGQGGVVPVIRIGQTWYLTEG